MALVIVALLVQQLIVLDMGELVPLVILEAEAAARATQIMEMLHLLVVLEVAAIPVEGTALTVQVLAMDLQEGIVRIAELVGEAAVVANMQTHLEEAEAEVPEGVALEIQAIPAMQAVQHQPQQPTIASQ